MLFSLALLAQLFNTPISAPTTVQGQLWALPICLSIALVYKTLKLKTLEPKTFIREVLLLFITIIGFLILAAIILWFVALLAGQM